MAGIGKPVLDDPPSTRLDGLLVERFERRALSGVELERRTQRVLGRIGLRMRRQQGRAPEVEPDDLGRAVPPEADRHVRERACGNHELVLRLDAERSGVPLRCTGELQEQHPVSLDDLEPRRAQDPVPARVVCGLAQRPWARANAGRDKQASAHRLTFENFE